MKEIEEILEMARFCTADRKQDMFNVTLINTLEDYALYLKREKEKETALYSLQKKCQMEEDTCGGFVAEDIATYNSNISFESIVRYAEDLDSSTDVNTIKLMLYAVYGNRCSREDYARIGALKPHTKASVTNNYHVSGDVIRNGGMKIVKK